MDERKNYLIVAGPARSGTSLLSKLLNECVPNVVCVNEVLPQMDVSSVLKWFKSTSIAIMDGRSIYNRYDRSGNLTSNSWRDGAERKARKVEKNLSEEFYLGHKFVVGVTEMIQSYLTAGIKVLAIVRDPMYTLASWSEPLYYEQVHFRITDDDLHMYWKARKHKLTWKSKGRSTRQAEVWEKDASSIIGIKPSSMYQWIRYEDFIEDTYGHLERIYDWLDCGNDSVYNVPNLQSKNRADRYKNSDFGLISDALAKYAPTAKLFGYEV